MSQLLISVIHSILDGKALIKTVLRHYPISNIRKCKLYKRGLNDTYLVETEQERYILRVYRRGWRNKQEIDFELELLAFLREQKQSVAYPIARKNGVFTTEIAAPEGTRYVAVFSYAPGHAVNEKLDGIQSYRLGEALAKIHQTLEEFKSSFTRPALKSEYLLDCHIGESTITTPYKKPRKKEISELQKKENQQLSSRRIGVEHLIGKVKIFRVASDKFPLARHKYSQVIMTVCGLVRLRLNCLLSLTINI